MTFLPFAAVILFHVAKHQGWKKVDWRVQTCVSNITVSTLKSDSSIFSHFSLYFSYIHPSQLNIYRSLPIRPSHHESQIRRGKRGKVNITKKTNKTLPVRVLIKRKQDLIQKPFSHLIHLARFKTKSFNFFFCRCQRNPRTNRKAHFTVDAKRRQKEKVSRFWWLQKFFMLIFTQHTAKFLIRAIWSVKFSWRIFAGKFMLIKFYSSWHIPLNYNY